MSTTQQTARPDLEALDARLVPAVDLTFAGAEGAVGGAIVRQVDAQPTGTGHIQSFLRIQGASSGGGSERGYNTDARPLQLDENKSPQFTRSFTLGKVPVVEVNGVKYREFLLDINQKSSASRLSVDEVRLFLGKAGNLTATDAEVKAGVKTLAGNIAVYDLDAAGDTSVMLDARLNSGSGSGDMVLLVPESRFAGASVNDYLYLYSKMGATAGATANGGFEEWAVRSTGVVTPPPAAAGTSSLSGRVYIAGTDIGIAGVTVHLRGRDAYQNDVHVTAKTNDAGYYSFTGLQAGEYSLWEEQPEGYADGIDYVGRINGTYVGALAVDADDLIKSIRLGVGEHGVDYDFTEEVLGGAE